ncbi:hypothetical protein [Streptomyces sp. NPDC054783]
MDQVHQDVHGDAAPVRLCGDQVELVAGAVDQHTAVWAAARLGQN